MPTFKINDNGTLREIERVFINDNGVLREVTEGYVNDNGTLRQFFEDNPLYIDQYPNPTTLETVLGQDDAYYLTIYTSKDVTWTYTLPSKVNLVSETSTELELEWYDINDGGEQTFTVTVNSVDVTVTMGSREPDERD